MDSYAWIQLLDDAVRYPGAGWTDGTRQHGEVAQPSLLVGVRDNAAAMRAGGDLAGACEYLLRALDSARDAFGTDEPEVLWTAHLLARLQREAGDPTAARRLLEESLAAGELRLGDREPVMLAIAYELATLAEELGNRHEARRNFARVAAAGPAQLGDDHWQVRAAREYLAGPSVAAVDPAPTAAQREPDLPTRPVPPTRPTPPAPAPPVSGREVTTAADRPPPLSTAVTGPAAGVSAPPQSLPVVVAVGAAAAAVIAAVVVVIVGVTVLLDGRATTPTGPERPGSDPTAVGDPPTALRLTDDTTAVTLTWSDPTAGTVPFIVASGRSGQQLGALATVNPGQTVFTVNGLNPELDYCFAVLAVYSADEYVPSDQVCTDRRTADPD
ncbi:tetratricopeptide repeat protein [Micromonospora sp. LOL_015]|uniref:fibronectin type III domain-containing protein n=1 Tax=Micromonospora sp. LOL_015 TaxID=3345416 RepID=UPI003A8B5B8E